MKTVLSKLGVFTETYNNTTHEVFGQLQHLVAGELFDFGLNPSFFLLLIFFFADNS
jgi:hypothetical protein